MKTKILVIGACGQIGSELTQILRERNGIESVVASDINKSNAQLLNSGQFEIVDATDYNSIKDVIVKHNIDSVFLMAAMLSAKGEKYPQKAWDLNMTSLFNVLNLAKEKVVKRVFWPSSIAVFGPTTPKENTSQQTIMEPTTVYGMTKLIGERWCEYYNLHYGVDVRSIRYPGIISWKTLPGGGTTDYAIEIFHKALDDGKYKCFLDENTELPMMYMDDAIDATLDIMNADVNSIRVRSSYNLAGVSFTPKELAESIKKRIPEFSITYNPDYRQEIADSWPKSIDDSKARDDWGWEHKFDLDDITEEMIYHLKEKTTV